MFSPTARVISVILQGRTLFARFYGVGIVRYLRGEFNIRPRVDMESTPTISRRTQISQYASLRFDMHPQFRQAVNHSSL